MLMSKIVAFCLLTSMVLGLTTDDILGRAGRYASFVPQFFGSKSLPAASRAELASGRDHAAVSTARAAVLRQPLSVEALGALARSTVVSEPRLSSEALAQAARLGWRDVAVQASVIESASLTKKWDVAAPRLLALANLNALDNIDPAVFASGDAPDYASKIAPAFSGNGLAWFKFAKWLRDNGLERQSEALLAHTPAYEREEACATLGLTASEFVRAGRVDFAAELVDPRCRNFLTSASSALAIDQNFGDRDRGPFEWQVVSQPGVSVRLETTNEMTFAVVENSDPIPRTIARKIARTRAVQSESVIYFNKIGASSSSRKNMPLEFECATLQPTQNSKAIPTVNESMFENCLFVRVKFQLPPGRFKLWTD